MENKKFQNLLTLLREMRSALLAFSGGVDSAFLLKAIQLAGIKALSVTASSEIIPDRDIREAQAIAEEVGLKHRIIHTDILMRDEFVRNTPDRCFHCKCALFQQLQAIAGEQGYRFILDGSNSDDTNEFRPGRKAAVQYNVRSPLIEADFMKNEIRELSRRLGLATWDKPSNTCLATRFPYGQRITKEALQRIEKAEYFLHSLGFNELRVRDHGAVARIELGKEEISLLLDPMKRAEISAKLKSFGYAFISLDLDGYRSGSMDRGLRENS